MLVGARGMGKTHFVSLVYHRLKQQPELHDRLLIAWLREEEYGVNSWLYLIIEILRSLSQEGIDTEEQINKLASLPISEAEYLANRVLTEVIGDRTLLIITENIDKLLYGLGDKEQWKFRSFLQETNCCSILATTPKISQDTSKKEKPFFNFFTSIHLPNFTHADAVAMLIKIANLSRNTQLAKFLDTDEGKSRVRALHHLAGGNPRVYALFAQLITEDTLEALLPAVIEMLDKLTPYYQSRVESLGQSDDQQKIVMYLARETRAVTVNEITAQCFISSENTTSNALKKLTQKGFLISTKKGREVYYEISEVLMRLCLEMKNAKNGDLKLCVDFIRIWFRPNECQEYLERLESDGKLEHAKYFRLSLADTKLDPILLACKRDLQNFLDSGDIYSALQVWKELVCVNKICEIKDRIISELINSEESPDTILVIEALMECRGVDMLYTKGFFLYQSKRLEEALEIFEIFLDIKQDSDDGFCWQGNILQDLDRHEEAIMSYDCAIKINPNNDTFWTNRALSLDELGKHEEAILSYDRAIKINPNDVYYYIFRGFSLNKLGKHEKAIFSYDCAIKIESDDDTAWRWRGVSLSKLSRYEEAITSYDRALQIKSNDDFSIRSRKFALDNLVEDWHNKGLADFKQEKYPDVLTLWQQAFNTIQQEQLANGSDLIQEFLDEQLLPKFQQPAVRDILPQILTIYTTAQVLPELGVALTRNLKAIQSPIISDYTATEWLKMWQELGKPHPELALALRMLEAGIKYKQNPTDDRVFLSLPQEMRPLLREALGLE
jgi:tetratricopeptide (TPR) repeat protein